MPRTRTAQSTKMQQDEDSGDLLEKVYVYLTEGRYPDDCISNNAKCSLVSRSQTLAHGRARDSGHARLNVRCKTTRFALRDNELL